MTSKREVGILKLLSGKEGKSLSEGNILRGLNIPEKKREDLRATLERMILEGKLKRTSKGRYRFGKPGKKTNGKDHRRSSSPVNGNRKKTVLDSFSNGKSPRVLAALRKTPEGFVACSRKAEIPDEYEVENGRARNSFSDGELVVIEIQMGKPSARVTERLGISGEIETEKKGIISEYRLPKGFSRDVTKEVEELNAEFSNGDISARVNLEKETIFTIDGDDAKDFDDAVGIKRIRKGYRLWVSIADVSYYVVCGSACDEEASRRATSTYLSDRVIPMLPQKLSNDLCSLRPKKDGLPRRLRWTSIPREGLRTQGYTTA